MFSLNVESYIVSSPTSTLFFLPCRIKKKTFDVRNLTISLQNNAGSVNRPQTCPYESVRSAILCQNLNKMKNSTFLTLSEFFFFQSESKLPPVSFYQNFFSKCLLAEHGKINSRVKELTPEPVGFLLLQ